MNQTLITLGEFRRRIAAAGGPQSRAWLAALCVQGRIAGAVRMGRDWYVPSDAVMPAKLPVGRRAKQITSTI